MRLSSKSQTNHSYTNDRPCELLTIHGYEKLLLLFLHLQHIQTMDGKTYSPN